jgi:hypothetical protein
LWWLALPVLLLPIWWHRQKRQRLKAEPLATARFLPAATPEQLRVWQWRDRILLLVRCLMLVALIAWLAATIFPWRGDTVLLDAGADKAWAEQQIAATGLAGATRIELPSNALQWLREHERDWRADAKLLIVARAGQVAMPARLPQFSHQVELRTTPAAPRTAALPAVARASGAPAVAASSAVPRAEAPAGHRIVLAAAPERAAAWRSLFAAFDRAGDGAGSYVIASEPGPGAELIVWDTPGAAPAAAWRAPHWWLASAQPAAPMAAFPELAKASTLTINGITLKYADSPRGRLWTSDVFPPRDADTARALYEAWQMLQAAPAPAYPAPPQTFAAARSPLPAITDAKPATWLMLALLALFILERILTHARRN